jgi:protoporphyrinogen oxidase
LFDPATEDATPVLIIGAGPAGLTAAYELAKRNRHSRIFEADAVVGGLARTAEYKGYLFDIGGHRFFTKVAAVEQVWCEVLGSDLLSRPRLSRILYNGKFFRYPLEPWDALARLGPVETVRCLASWAKAAMFPQLPEPDLEAFITNRFGRRLYEIFFKSYTEKVWGMPCAAIGAEWAAQRIRGMSFRSVVLHALGLRGRHGEQDAIKSFVERFNYPRRGPGMMWNRARELIEARYGTVHLRAPVTRITWCEGAVIGLTAGNREFPATQVLSSLPIRDLIRVLDPCPAGLREVEECFEYRDFLTVALVLRRRHVFPDNWIYVHEPEVRVGRIQNYKNWSPEMVPNDDTTCLGLEYFCFAGDGLWTMADDDLVDLAKREVALLGLAREADVSDGVVVRMRNAYPVYNETYKKGIERLRSFLQRVPNLQLIGRNGMHHYNNQDHSMLTAILAVRNIMGARYDLWRVNTDADYHEEGGALGEAELNGFEVSQPLVPQRVGSPP